MPRVLPRLLAALLLLSGIASAHADERILDYRIAVDVRADASLEVTEDITLRAEGTQVRRGITRDFPTRYRDRAGNAVVVGLEVLSVQRDGEREDWFTENLSNGVRINTGGDDLLPQLPGTYRYTLRYRTTRQIGFFAGHDELYWNAIGTGWAFPIDAGSVEVRLPAAVPVADMAAEGYTGPQGAKGQDYAARIVEPGLARWDLTTPLAPGEGLTIVLSFPKGLVPEPTTAQRLGWLLKDNRGVLVALAGFVVLLVYCVRRWRAVGRDPRPGVVIPRYEPPADRSPAELRYLRRRMYDTRCFTGDLLCAAVDGQVVIEREDRLVRRDLWRLQRLDATTGPPRLETPATLLAGLFPGGAGMVELDQAHGPILRAAQATHAKLLDARLHGSHFQRNAGSTAIAVVIAVATGVLAFLVSGGSGVPLIVVLGLLMLGVVIAFGWLVQAPTEEGRRLLDEIAGLRDYLGVAERDELASMKGPGSPPPLDAKRYELLLPYAIALDVEEAWTKKFTLAVGVAAAAAATSAITWYHGGRFDDMGSLAQAVGSGLNSSIASASTPPGSSSGSGGGGSSGGGGGGGGGGGR
ncbi:MAG: DUF2207 domain-containing protein [Xanthomonadaceae bacterium]|jgi:uncharacterized membrane protein YgcG|nr:DUF2207 domain-containing protein [Xanthomonadaceae bacterium]